MYIRNRKGENNCTNNLRICRKFISLMSSIAFAAFKKQQQPLTSDVSHRSASGVFYFAPVATLLHVYSSLR